jgi:hypothetical protein
VFRRRAKVLRGGGDPREAQARSVASRKAKKAAREQAAKEAAEKARAEAASRAVRVEPDEPAAGGEVRLGVLDRFRAPMRARVPEPVTVRPLPLAPVVRAEAWHADLAARLSWRRRGGGVDGRYGDDFPQDF